MVLTPKFRIAVYWVLTVAVPLVLLGILYIGAVLVILGPTMGPRGNIDFLDFPPAKQRSAEVQAVANQALGVLLALVSIIAIAKHRLVLRRFLKAQR